MSFTKSVSFADLLSAIVDNRGRTCPTADIGFPLIATNCVTNDTLYPKFEKVRFVSSETYATWFRGHPEPGDIIFVCKGSPGRVCLTPDPVSFCIAQDMVAVRADPARIYPLYLFAALRSEVIQDQIASLHVGTLIPHFKKGDFGKLLIPVPDPIVQRAIGELYFLLSKKVAVNDRIVEDSYELLQALWQQAAEGAKNVTPFSQIAGIEKGLTYKGSGLGAGAPLVNLANFGVDGRFKESALKHYEGQAKESHWIGSGDLVMANTDLTQRREILGQPALASFDTDKALFTHHVFAVRPHSGTRDDTLWLYCAFRDSAFRDRAITYATGTTVVALPRDAVLTYQLPWPDEAIRRKWARSAEVLVESISAFNRESQRLSRLRDALLPGLMSGAIRVCDAEKAVEEAT